MSDIFNRSGEQYGGSFSADSATVAFSGGGAGGGTLLGQSGGIGLLAQQIQVGYQQQIMRFYEIGTNYVYLVQGRSQGQLSMGQILGVKNIQTQFYKNYGDVCNAGNNNLSFSVAAGCNTSSGTSSQSTTFDIKSVVLTSLSLSVAAQDMVINQQLSAMYVALDNG